MKFEITETPTLEDIEFLTKQINEEASGWGVANGFAIFAYSDANEKIAGCTGSLVFGSIYTDQLWTREDRRGQGIGSKLMEEVHRFGKSKGCTLATVATMSFQAPDFYIKLGYRIDYTREGYCGNRASCIFLSKKLS